MEQKRDTGERMDALLRGADWAQMGTNGGPSTEPALPETMPAAAETAV